MTEPATSYPLGYVLYRAEGAWRGEYVTDGVELLYQEYQCVRVTARGGWFANLTFSHKRQRFALFKGCSWGSPTRQEALEQLTKRKTMQIGILETKMQEAWAVRALACDAIAAAKRAAA